MFLVWHANQESTSLAGATTSCCGVTEVGISFSPGPTAITSTCFLARPIQRRGRGIPAPGGQLFSSFPRCHVRDYKVNIVAIRPCGSVRRVGGAGWGWTYSKPRLRVRTMGVMSKGTSYPTTPRPHVFGSGSDLKRSSSSSGIRAISVPPAKPCKEGYA